MSSTHPSLGSNPITGAVSRWRGEYNRRRAAEAALWMAAALVGAGALVGALRLALGEAVPTGALVALAAGALGAVAAIRWRSRCISAAETALLMDRRHDTKDLLSTALAIEAAQIEAAPDLAALVAARARDAAPNLSLGDLGRVAYPKRAALFATLCVVAACATYLLVDNDDPFDGTAVAAGTDASGADEDPSAAGEDREDPENTPLPDEELAALRENLERIEALRERLAANSAVAERLEAIRQQMERVTSGEAVGTEALGALSRAERELAQLARESQEGDLLDPETAQQADPEVLAESLRSAIEQGDAQTAATLSAAMTQQAANAEAPQLQEMGEAVEATQRDASEMPQGDSRMSAEQREAADQQLDQAGDALSRADRGESVSELTELTEMLTESASEGSPTEDDLAEALEGLRQAREDQIAAINGEPSNRRPGENRPGREGSPDREAVAQRSDPRDGLTRPGRERGEGCEFPSPDSSGDPSSMTCENPGGDGRPSDRPGQDGSGDGEGPQTISVRGQGSGGTSPGPGQGPTPTPWEGELPELLMPHAEWIESAWDGAPDGVVQMIESASHGERSVLEYRELLRSYLEVAEASASREDIPLTRRNYIQDYFEAIRQ